ncbi:DUF192 domain-containing protein [Devosia neptuniae]|jgi:uncharacterized membrane protein (UPF0127 family)|uniref:DUF192 domain-containing protein n=1 Tax=Devosia TaxID=46913 RepID=UPI0022B07E2F|nr:DUF192 domain-containing protein [Devosia neptuniae]MCZ4346237.1 DUF192 domain-containing protein [Devosia neptuniae]|tara:strand:- start:63031 stop:63513 length:483 start_codon:yes stop_codon:yes gene_type:complete
MTLIAQGFAPVLRRAGALLAVLAVAAPLAACSDEGRLVLHTSTGEHAFNVEVVDTPETRAKGLMFVQDLADDAGMLFDFKQEREVSFWMRNTFIPLDMIFVGADGVVKTIHVNARPQDPTSIPSNVPVQFVLEIPGGRSVELGLKPGDTMEHERVGAPLD